MRLRTRTTCTLVIVTVLSVLLHVSSAHAGPVADMIAKAREVGSRHHPTEVARLRIELGLREIGPSGVDEALSILLSQSETEDVLAGLLRGLAIIRESTDPRIATTICRFTTPAFSERLRAEARESARIRCPTDSRVCSCQEIAMLPPMMCSPHRGLAGLSRAG